MADSYVSKDQFEEFTKRMEQGFMVMGERHNDLVRQMNERFTDTNRQMNERFTDANRQMNERFTDLKTDMAGIRADMRQMRSWLIGLYGLVVFGFIGSFMLAIFKEQIFK